MDKFIVAIIGFPISFLIVIYRFKIKQFTGDIDFADKIFGPGGTYTFLLVLALVIFIATLLYSTGTLQAFFYSTLGPLFFPKQ